MIGRHTRIGVVALVCLLAGCRHKVKPVVPQTATAPVPIEKAPEPDNPPVIAQVPLTPAPLPAVKVPVKRPSKPKKRVTPPPPAQPVQVASAGPAAAETAIGALTAGGDERPERKQQAVGLISDLDKRLAGLPAVLLETQKEGIARVRYFEREARTALDSGDTEGAVTLVTKAKLLLDDLVR